MHQNIPNNHGMYNAFLISFYICHSLLNTSLVFSDPFLFSFSLRHPTLHMVHTIYQQYTMNSLFCVSSSLWEILLLYVSPTFFSHLILYKILPCFVFSSFGSLIIHLYGILFFLQDIFIVRVLRKLAAIFGFSVIGEKVFLRRGKKYTFGKSIFKTFFQNRISQILPPFLSTSDS